MKYYTHPQGSTITLHDNGAIVKVNKAGKVVSTSATAEKLAVGHGGWVEVESLDAAAEAPAPKPQQAAPTKVLLPMKFKEAPVEELPKYVSDPQWIVQQKVDGVRAMLVMEGGERPWFRNGTGGVLSSATAQATTNPILAALPGHPDGEAGYTIDGEVLNGVYYVFDLIRHDLPEATLAYRLDALSVWHAAVVAAGLGARVQLLPTGFTVEEKAALGRAVLTEQGEGWIVKRLDSKYDFGSRVTHSLKLKITSTVDVVVMARNRDSKSNFVVGLHRDGVLTEVGCSSAIGKPDAQPGDVIEVKYLYVGADGRLVQPTVMRTRPDKAAADCTADQLRHVNKSVVQPS